MGIGSPPELDVARVQRWCRDRVPAGVRHQLTVESEVAGRDVTILECRLPWDPEAGAAWTRSPVARLRYLKSRGVWRLYWRDRDESWHEYPDLPWARDVDDLLAEIESDPTAIFWG